VFYHLTYEGAVDIEKVTDPVERLALEAQIAEFGKLTLSRPISLSLTQSTYRTNAAPAFRCSSPGPLL
jgi:factor associated with neutral sphingomyelinase activation